MLENLLLQNIEKLLAQSVLEDRCRGQSSSNHAEVGHFKAVSTSTVWKHLIKRPWDVRECRGGWNHSDTTVSCGDMLINRCHFVSKWITNNQSAHRQPKLWWHKYCNNHQPNQPYVQPRYWRVAYTSSISIVFIVELFFIIFSFKLFSSAFRVCSCISTTLFSICCILIRYFYLDFSLVAVLGTEEKLWICFPFYRFRSPERMHNERENMSHG